MNSKIAANYPGTKLSFSEYDYGGGGDISGGIAQADVLGIFGAQGVFAATQWALEARSQRLRLSSFRYVFKLRWQKYWSSRWRHFD